MAAFMISLALLFTTPDTITLDATHQLFLDDHLVETSVNITRRTMTATKHARNPILQGDQPWEADRPLLYGSVLKEDNTYRMWYYMPRGVCYAESADGITWTKTLMDQYPWEGQASNIVLHANGLPNGETPFPHFYEVFGVFRDDRDPDPQRRYKMGYLSLERDYTGPDMDPFHAGQRRGLGVAASPDGLHWSPVTSWATYAIVDGATHWAYDPDAGRYHLYGRSKRRPAELESAWKDDPWYQKHFWGRVVAHTTSTDFVNWEHTRPDSAPIVMGADLQDDIATEVYGMGAFKYGNAFVGLVQRFHSRPEGTALDIQLAVSHDGNNFARVSDRTPFLPNGGVGEWDRFNMALANNPPIEEGDDLRFYYSNRRYRHGPYEGLDSGPSSCAIGVASIPRDRFLAMESDYAGGELLTKTLAMESPDLHINASAKWGEILIEALDPDGNVVATAMPIVEDALDIPIVWKDAAPREKNPLQLKFTIRNAKLFSIWCVPSS